MTKIKPFFEAATCEASENFIASHVLVYTDGEGYFITVETDSYEGSAMMTLPVARKLLGGLERAIAAADIEGPAYQRRELAKHFAALYRPAEKARLAFHKSPNFRPYQSVVKDLRQHADIREIAKLVALWDAFFVANEEWERRYPAPSGYWWGCDQKGEPALFSRTSGPLPWDEPISPAGVAEVTA